MDEFDKRVIADFIGENWDLFCDFCYETYGLSEESEAEEILNHLENHDGSR